MDKPTAKGEHITLYPEQKATLIQVAKDLGLGNVSAATRYIIEDWKRLRAKADGFQIPAGLLAPEEVA